MDTNHATTTIPVPAVPLDPAQPPAASTVQRLAEQADGGYPVVRLLNGAGGVILGTNDTGVDLLILPGTQPCTVHPDRAGTLVTDPAEQAVLLRQALTALTGPAAAERVTEQAAVIELRREHATRLDDIREYAIARHVDGDICRDGLNRFLTHFDLDPYSPRLRVNYTITGSYELEGSAREPAERDARGYLKVDHGSLDHFTDNSGEHTVTINGVEELESY